MSEASAHTNIYTAEDYYNLPENVRAELIDGRIYYMSAPFAVKLFEDNDRTVVEPDISVICDPGKLTDRGCTGAPDWIVYQSGGIPAVSRRKKSSCKKQSRMV